MADTCEFHEDMVRKREEMEKRQKDHDIALEGKVAKSSIKWLAAIFALPTIAAALTVWAFMASAEYRYGTSREARDNASNIRLLDERTVTMKADMFRMGTDVANALHEVKAELGEVRKELREIRK